MTEYEAFAREHGLEVQRDDDYTVTFTRKGRVKIMLQLGPDTAWMVHDSDGYQGRYVSSLGRSASGRSYGAKQAFEDAKAMFHYYESGKNR